MKTRSYVSLMRIHALGGMWLCFFPALFVILLLGSDFISMLWIPFFLLGAFTVRSAGCIINDIVDRRFDSNVRRTVERPIARGKVKVTEAISLAVVLLALAAALLLLLPTEALILGILTLIGIVVYPFTKRYLFCPQFFLSAVFNVGALFASLAITNSFHSSAFFVYLACCFWTIYYDTIYGHQDKHYDTVLGLHSLSLTKFGSKIWLKKYARIALSFLAFAGVLPGLNFLYYTALAALFLAEERFTESIDLDDPENCARAFKNMNFAGLLILFLISLGKL